MQAIIDAFYMTMELWIFLAILAGATLVEDLKNFYKKQTSNNPTLW